MEVEVNETWSIAVTNPLIYSYSSLVSCAKSFLRSRRYLPVLVTVSITDCHVKTHNWSNMKRTGDKDLFYDRRSRSVLDAGINRQAMHFFHYIAR